jgi:hypothetical protein
MAIISNRTYPMAIVESIITRHFRLSGDDSELFEQAKRCVCTAFDIAEDYTNRIIVACDATFALGEAEEGVLRLPTAPVKEVKEVRYLASNGEWHTLTTEDYELSGDIRSAELELLTPISATRFKVTAACGFEDYNDEEDKSDYALPGAIEQAVTLIAQTALDGEALSGVIEQAVHNMLNPWRIYPYGG